MAISKNDKHKEYAHYAAHCLEMAPLAPNQKFWTFNAKWRQNGLDLLMPPCIRLKPMT
jgi:hypothetical protein